MEQSRHQRHQHRITPFLDINQCMYIYIYMQIISMISMYEFKCSFVAVWDSQPHLPNHSTLAPGKARRSGVQATPGPGWSTEVAMSVQLWSPESPTWLGGHRWNGHWNYGKLWSPIIVWLFFNENLRNEELLGIITHYTIKRPYFVGIFPYLGLIC